MFHIQEAELLGLISAFIWPFFRIGAMLITLPVFTGHTVPARVRLVLAVGVTLAAMPLTKRPLAVELFSFEGVTIAFEQILIGLFMGFVLQLVFAAVVFAGQTVAYGMGLGFATMVDPMTGIQVPVISQFYLILATLVFLTLGGHLVMIEMVVDSFQTLPMGMEGITRTELWKLVAWSSRLFAAGVLLSIPVMTILLLTNIGFGVATRAAPQLNIFAVGFPVTLLVGLVLVWVTLPDILSRFSGILSEGYQLMNEILRF